MRSIIGLLLCFVTTAAAAQSAPDWQKKAGGSMSFEVASIRLSQPEKFSPPSFPLSPDDSFRDPAGSFHADFPLRVYIQFAYKVWPTREQNREMLAKLPEWVDKDRYSILAKAPLGATKDQYRLMIQQLLAERFGLKVHFEQRETPVLELTLEKPGHPGAQLTPHDKGPSCDKPDPDVFPSMCYAFGLRPKNGIFEAATRANSMELIANFIAQLGETTGEISRPVVDRTGLTGLWDMRMEGTRPSPDASAGPSLLEALPEQLGLKLKPGKAVLPVLVIDHIDRPTDN